LTEKIYQCRTNWKEPVERMEDYRIPKLLLNQIPALRRIIGRLKKKWTEMFNT
jgi:hypothetical protein